MSTWLFVACILSIGFTISVTADDSGFRIYPDMEGSDQKLRMEWQSADGLNYFVRSSPDMGEWLLLPWIVEGDGAMVRKTEADSGETRFFQLFRQERSNVPWVTSMASTPRVEYRLLYSDAIAGPVSYHIYLPTPYALQPLRRFPVLYWLHGSGPGVLGIPALTRYFHDAIQSRLIPPMIVVFPNSLPDGMWCDSKDGLQPVETIVMSELIPHIDRNFRTVADPSGRIIEGFSMGGYGAGRLALKYPSYFIAFSMMGAGPLQLDFLEDNPLLVHIQKRREIFESVYGNDMDYFEAQSPWRLAEANATNLPENLVIRQIVGTGDNMLWHNRFFHQRLLELEIAHEYIELEDIGHNAMDVLNALGSGNFDFYNRIFNSQSD